MTMPTVDDAATRHIARIAHEAARRLGHGWIGAEHLLFATSAEPDPTGDVLRRSGLSPRPVWRAIEDVVGVGTWAMDRDALAAIGIDADAVLAAAGTPPGISADLRSNRHRRRRGHLPLNAVATRCLAATASPGGHPSSVRTAILARCVLQADSRTVELLLRRGRVDTARLSRELDRIVRPRP